MNEQCTMYIDTYVDAVVDTTAAAAAVLFYVYFALFTTGSFLLAIFMNDFIETVCVYFLFQAIR